MRGLQASVESRGVCTGAARRRGLLRAVAPPRPRTFRAFARQVPQEREDPAPAAAAPPAAPLQPAPAAPSTPPPGAKVWARLPWGPAGAAAAAAGGRAVPVPPPQGSNSQWVPVSGPPSDDAPELRRMHVADAAAPLAQAAAPPPAPPAPLVIGRREAREQAAALAVARQEIARLTAVAEAALAAERLLAARGTELQGQRDEAIALTRELLAGCSAVQDQLKSAAARLQAYDSYYTQVRQEVLSLRAAAAATAAASGNGTGSGAGSRGAMATSSSNGTAAGGWLGSVLSAVGNGHGRAAGGAEEASTPVPTAADGTDALQQLLETSRQLAEAAERDEEKLQRVAAQLDGTSDTEDLPSTRRITNGAETEDEWGPEPPSDGFGDAARAA